MSFFFCTFAALIIITRMYKCKYSRLRVALRIRQMARQINKDHLITPDTVFLVMLSGGVWFSSKLFDALGNLNHPVFYIKGHSYTNNQRGQFIWDIMPDIELKNKNVIVIDDICDSGETLLAIQQLLQAQEVSQLTAITLLKRCPSKIENQIPLYSCFHDHSKDYFVGCGLDDNGHSRLLRYIGVC